VNGLTTGNFAEWGNGEIPAKGVLFGKKSRSDGVAELGKAKAKLCGAEQGEAKQWHSSTSRSKGEARSSTAMAWLCVTWQDKAKAEQNRGGISAAPERI